MRRLISISCLSVALIWPAQGASSGGATFEFSEDYFAPGERVEASTLVWMGSGEMGVLDEGPFEAYLLPQDKWIDPPHIPAEALSLGPVEFTVTGPKEAHAGVSFVVPDVPSASYSINYCNDPCTVATVGDLIGGWFMVAEDAEDATLVAKVSRLEMRNSQKAFRIGELNREARQLERARLRVAERVARVRAEVADLEVPPQSSGESSGEIPAGWLVVAAVVGLVGGSVARGRRRKEQRLADPIPSHELTDQFIRARDSLKSQRVH